MSVPALLFGASPLSGGFGRYGTPAYDCCGECAARALADPPETPYRVEFADLRRSRERIAEELHEAVLELESDWLREAQAALRQFLWERAGADSFAKRRSV